MPTVILIHGIFQTLPGCRVLSEVTRIILVVNVLILNDAEVLLLRYDGPWHVLVLHGTEGVCTAMDILEGIHEPVDLGFRCP